VCVVSHMHDADNNIFYALIAALTANGAALPKDVRKEQDVGLRPQALRRHIVHVAKRIYKQSNEDSLEEALFERICTSLQPGMQTSLEVVQFLAQILDLNVNVIVSASADSGAPKVHCYEGDHINMNMSFSIAHDFQAGMQPERCC